MPSFLSDKKHVIVLSALILFHLILISIQAPRGAEESYLERGLYSVFVPLQHGFVSFFRKIGDIWHDYFDLRGVRSRNRSLEEEVIRLRQENAMIRQILEAYQSDKELQERYRDMAPDIIPCRIIGMDMASPFSSVSINRGSLDGVKRNMMVMDDRGHLAGRIIGPVGLKESRVQLITDADSGIGVQVGDENGAHGILKGMDRELCELRYILSTEDITQDIEVVTSGNDKIFMKGIKVGAIVSVENPEEPEEGLFWKIRVRPYFDVRRLSYLAVIGADPTELL